MRTLGALPYNDTAVVDESWDGPGNEAAIPNDAGADVLRQMYAWVDPNGKPDAKSSYKLPHHKVVNGKPGAANVNGARAALSRLGQSGTQIPDGDKAAVRSHLQKHIDKFNASQKGKGSFDEFVVELDAGAALVIETEGKTFAVRPEMLAVLERLHGQVVSASMLSDMQAARPTAAASAPKNGVAVIPLHGMITPSSSFLSMLFGGGGGLSQFRSQLSAAAGDPEVKSIVLDVDSPGGLVDQVPETAAVIRQAREAKPIVAVANTMAASAAYWLASQAHEVAVTPSGEAGSIGVYQLHRDMSEAHAMRGIKPTLVSAGKYKVEGNPYEPLNDEATGAIQQAVDDYYGMFVNDVAAGRGVDPQEVRDGYGLGRSVLAQRAVKQGLADRVATLGATVSRLGSGRAKVRQTSADDGDGDELLASVEYSPEERDRVLDTLAALR